MLPPASYIVSVTPLVVDTVDVVLLLLPDIPFLPSPCAVVVTALTVTVVPVEYSLLLPPSNLSILLLIPLYAVFVSAVVNPSELLSVIVIPS